MRRYIVQTAVCAAAILFMGGCKTHSAYQLSGEWDVVELQGEQIRPAENTPFVGFDLNESRVYGFTGCNRITGTVDVAQMLKGKADFSRLGSTRMLCHEDKYESRFFEAMSAVKAAECAKSEILLKDDAGRVLLKLKKR